MPGSNLPPGTYPGDPKAPWNRPEPKREIWHLDVQVGLSVEVTENAETRKVFDAIRKALDAGEYEQVLDYDIGDKEAL